MIAAAAMTRDALDGDGQVAIALGDHGHELVYLLGRLRRRFDLDPAANAVEDGPGIEGIGCRQHGALHWQWEDRWTGVNVTLARFRARRNPLSVSSALVRSFARGDLFDHLDNASPELGVGDARER